MNLKMKKERASMWQNQLGVLNQVDVTKYAPENPLVQAMCAHWPESQRAGATPRVGEPCKTNAAEALHRRNGSFHSRIPVKFPIFYCVCRSVHKLCGFGLFCVCKKAASEPLTTLEKFLPCVGKSKTLRQEKGNKIITRRISQCTASMQVFHE